jgi:hypothetical protein
VSEQANSRNLAAADGDYHHFCVFDGAFQKQNTLHTFIM